MSSSEISGYDSDIAVAPNSPKELVPLTATECSSSLMPSYSNETIIRIKLVQDWRDRREAGYEISFLSNAP